MTSTQNCSTGTCSPSGIVCGTGGWTGPKPGDPDLGPGSVRLSAVPVFGGIRISWSWPAVNGHAVAYTKLFRSTSSQVASAVELAVVAGNTYLDQMDGKNTFYYWIQLTSVNGTVGEKIGPVSATSRDMGDDILTQITDEIDKGILAQSLKEEIDKITLTRDELFAEIQARLANDEAFQALYEQLQQGVLDTFTLISQERTERINGMDALARVQNTLAAANRDNLAAITEEKLARVSADEAMAQQISTIAAATQNNAAAIFTESQTRANADSAMASQITQLHAANNQLSSAISTETTARVNEDRALANRITTVQTSLENDISSVQWGAQSQINTLDGKVTQIGALWTAKVQVNGLIGGFGVYNDGREVQAGFDVDTFWVGRTNSNKRKPFVVKDGDVYIDNARIYSADIKTLHIDGNAVTIPMAKEGIYGMSFSPSSSWTASLDTDFTYYEGGTYLNVMVAVTCEVTSGGDCQVLGSIVNSGGGEATFIDTVQTMRSNDKLTAVFVGGIVLPHHDNWRVRVRLRNSWHNGTWVSKKTNIIVLGARR